MCGIVGVLGCGTRTKKQEEVRQEIMMYLTTELMNLTEARGKDASGVSALFNNGEFIIIKSGMPSPQFLSMFEEKDGKTYKKFLKICRENGSSVKSFIGHCRKASVGNTWDNVNNHPIRVGDIVGVHNGTLKNHDRVFELLAEKRDGSVDSESIFKLFEHFTNKAKEPFTIDIVKEIGTKLEGSFAVMAANSNNPYQIALLRDARPIELALLKDYGIVLVASEKKFIETALFSLNVSTNLHKMFLPATNLSGSNVSFGDVSNCHAAILDLTIDVDDKTKISDILTEERMATTDDDWKEDAGKSKNEYTNYHRNHVCGYNNRGYHTPASGNASVNSLQKSTNGDDDKKNVGADSKTSAISSRKLEDSIQERVSSTESETHSGMIWNKNTKRFANISASIGKNNIEDVIIDSLDDVRIKPKLSIVEDIKSGNVIKTDSNDVDNKKFNLVEVSPGNNKDFEKEVGISAKIECFHMGIEKKQEESKEKNGNVVDNKSEKLDGRDLISLDRTCLESAYKYRDCIDHFSSDEDLAMYLEISEASVRSLPAYALANRINKTTTLKAYYDGYQEHSKKNPNTKSEDKSKSTTETNIRVLKNIVNIVMGLIPKVERYKVENRIIEAMNSGVEINSEKFSNVISDGDIKRHRVLRWMGSIIKQKESR